MSSNLIKVQRFLIIAVLILACVALGLFIYIKYENEKALQKASIAVSQDILQERVYDINQSLNESDKSPFAKTYELDFNATLSDDQSSELEMPEFFELNKSLNEPLDISLLDTNLSLDKGLEQNQSLIEINDKNESKTTKPSKAKLAIIIDDIYTKEHVKELKDLNLKVTPSFFPQDKIIKNTSKLAKNFDFYMIHLPLAAINYESKLDTLSPNDTRARIGAKITQIRSDFKDAKFINNHTGSLYTSDLDAMNKLYEELVKQGFIFVDSKTTPKSKAEICAKNFNQNYIVRDVFLDNVDDLKKIKEQLKKAVQISQKKGFAIAIGHPRKATFEAISQSKDLLSGVELVYLSEVYDK